MTVNSQAYPPLAESIWSSDNSLLRKITLVIAGSIVLWISAKIQIPFYPVPITMQTFVVLVIGMTFGWRLGGATLLLYLGEGAVGFPVFAGTPEKGIGLAYLVGPTGGYLLGQWLAAMAVGWLAEKGWDRNPIKTVFAMFIGNAIIYIPGLFWLGSSLGWDKPIFAWGLTPFLLGDLAKLILAAMLLPLAWKIINAKPSDTQNS